MPRDTGLMLGPFAVAVRSFEDEFGPRPADQPAIPGRGGCPTQPAVVSEPADDPWRRGQLPTPISKREARQLRGAVPDSAKLISASWSQQKIADEVGITARRVRKPFEQLAALHWPLTE